MKEKIKNIIKKSIKTLREIKKILFDNYSTKLYSQEGEDTILSRIFEKKKTGFYVDVGAHHPMRFSNTYFFYKKGWMGINIDAMPGSMKIFNKLRKRDINLEMAISDKREVIKYYIFNESALNTFSKNVVNKRLSSDKYKIIFTKELETMLLREVLDIYLPKNRKIDFLNIDVEGLEFRVLKSNDWEKYKPKVILIEILETALEELVENPIYMFLKDKGYKLFSKTFNTAIFKRYNYNDDKE